MTKTVLVTGATSGIGEACVRRFAKEGYRVIIAGRNRNKLTDLGKKLMEDGVEVLGLEFDVRDHIAAEKAINSMPEEWKDIDVLVNNAGLALSLDKEYELSIEEMETMVDTNIKGLFFMTKLIVPGMVRRNKGHVINIGSLAGDGAYAGGSVYCATKAAVKILSDGLRIDVADTKIRVTDVKPGLVETNFSNVRFHGDKAKAGNVYKGITPLSGYDIADVVFYAANVPEHVQIAEVLVTATHQANSYVVARNNQ